MKILAPSILPIPEPPRPSVALPILIAGLVASIVLILSVCLLLAREARAHEAPMGWAYGIECCSSLDCSQANGTDITEIPQGYRVNLTGEVIPYTDTRIKRSKDEFYHRCTPGGRPAEPRSICLYVPDRGM